MGDEELYFELADQAIADLDEMSDRDADRVEDALERAFGRAGREDFYEIAAVDTRVSKVWRTYTIDKPPCVAVFKFMEDEARAERGLQTSAHVIAAIPSLSRLDQVLRDLIAEEEPDDWDWD